MKLHSKQIPLEGLHVEGEEDCPLNGLENEDVRCAGPLSFKLDVGMSGDALWANGSLHQSVELRCVSCLEKFVHDIEVPGFAVHTELRGREAVDLTPFMREDLLLNLPAHPHCDRHGNRVCKAEQIETEGQITKREADWSALDRLNIRNR